MAAGKKINIFWIDFEHLRNPFHLGSTIHFALNISIEFIQ